MTLATKLRELRPETQLRLGYALGCVGLDVSRGCKTYSTAEVLDILQAIAETPGAATPRESR